MSVNKLRGGVGVSVAALPFVAPTRPGSDGHALALSTPVQWWQSKLDNPAIGWMSGSIIALNTEVQNDRSNNGTNQR